MPDNAETIANNALKPKSATIDGNSATQHDISDQILADKYQRAAEAVTGNPFKRIRRARYIPPGAV